ncbi:MAG: glycerophosphodiester phosphodiesterase, partial [Bacilli bacterium]|nr:glycerophosphodiester phosphodiesterase [Bacilli bacterium]
MKKIETKIVGHRGASGLVEHENTIEAFQKAIEIGCYAIECDIRKTKDDILVINHDPFIKDLVIEKHSYQELNDYTMSLGYHL